MYKRIMIVIRWTNGEKKERHWMALQMQDYADCK